MEALDKGRSRRQAIERNCGKCRSIPSPNVPPATTRGALFGFRLGCRAAGCCEAGRLAVLPLSPLADGNRKAVPAARGCEREATITFEICPISVLCWLCAFIAVIR